MLRTGLSTGRRAITGTGSPEGAVTGSRGDIYLRQDSAAGTGLYVKETGDATNTGWSVVVSGGGIDSKWVPADVFTGVPGNGAIGATITYGVNCLRVMDFDAGRVACATIAMPPNWNLGTVLARVYWIANVSNHGARTWNVGCNAVSNAESMPLTISTTPLTGTDTANDIVYITSQASMTPGGATPAVNDLLQLYVSRGVDGIAGKLEFIGMRIRYGIL